jgi:sialic acid synthase SpsE
MLRELAGFFDHFIISTGAMYDHEIKKAAKLMNDLGKKVTFLHCMTAYPNELNMCNLNRMNWLREIVDSVGWSDHTNVLKDDILASMIAIYSGADFIERHFTILDHSETKDGIVSISPSMLERLSRFRTMGKTEQGEEIKKIISNLRPILGESKRNLTNTELLNRDYYRGRFASINKGKIVYNWEEKDLPSTYNE